MKFLEEKEIITPPSGSVELTEKLVPICELEDDQLHPDGHYAFTRAVVDVSSLKKKLNDMPQELWEVSKYSIEYIAISSY